MARFPEIQRLAREEANAILGYGPESVKPTADQCREMKYIDAIIKEVMQAKDVLLTFILTLLQ